MYAKQGTVVKDIAKLPRFQLQTSLKRSSFDYAPSKIRRLKMAAIMSAAAGAPSRLESGFRASTLASLGIPQGNVNNWQFVA